MGLIEEFLDLFGVDRVRNKFAEIIERCEKKTEESSEENKETWNELTEFWKKKLNDFNEKFRK